MANRTWRRGCGLLAVLATCGSLATTVSRAASGAGIGPAYTAHAITCSAPALGGRLPAMVYVPAGAGRRLPVIYFLHGLPSDPGAYRGFAYLAAALSASAREAIIVVPQAAPMPNSDREYLDWSPHEDWPEAIARDLPRCVDARYRTIASRSGRALIGVSAGGYGALNIGLRHLDTFAAVQSWSGYFAATDSSGRHVLRFGSARARAAAQVPRGSALRHALQRWPSLVAFYVGRTDTQFSAANRQFDQALTASRVGHIYRTYPGAHSASLWQREAPSWLAMALGYLAGAG